MKIKPLGFYVLIEMVSVKQDGLIELPQDLIDKEQDATDTGYVRAIGPTAYFGYPGCDTEILLDGVMTKIPALMPSDRWGLEIGQKIEYRKFEGKKSGVEGHENYRYIPDSHIIGVIDDE